MDTNQVLNVIGLALITVGGIAGALAAPAPQYHSDGSVSLAPKDSDKETRIAIHKRQKRFPIFLAAVGAGSALQAVALFITTAACG